MSQTAHAHRHFDSADAPADSVQPAAEPSPAARALLQPYRLSDALELPNRLVMAPMTRSMAGDGLVPTAASAAYYARRAAAGLLVTEATLVSADGQGYPDTPGIWSAEQVEGWRKVTSAVHRAGGRIFLQLWHVGRVSHPVFLGGELPVAPSAVPLEGSLPRRRDLSYGTPRALAAEEIPGYVRAFADGAANALRAGFDGVEIHGANAYLVDQFLHHHTNRREDEWGGSPQNMSRFALQVVDAVVERVGAERTGIRLSPGAYVHMEGDPRDADVFRYLLGELEQRDLAYVHAGVFDGEQTFDELGGLSSVDFLRRHYRGTVIGVGGLTPERAARDLASGRYDLAALGRPFLANPDLVDRVREAQDLAPYDPAMLATLE